MKTVRFACLVALFATSGCAYDVAELQRGDDATASVSVALTTVPATVTCVRLQATVGSAAPVVVLATVTPNTSSATLNLGRLPAGQATISGTAYALACSDPTIGTTASPLWLADPVMATFTVGATVTVPLTFHINNPVAVSANFVKNVSSLSVGPKSSYAVMADATVKVTGSSGAGIGTLLTPGDLPGATSVAEVAVAASFACLRTKAGVVSCWGNTPGSASSIPTPTPVTLPGPALQIALGTSHACAIVQVSQLNNPLFCWGSNVFGQLGTGSFMTSNTPVQFAGLAGGDAVAFVAAGGDTTCAIGTSSRVSCWGRGSSGQTGDGTAPAAQSLPTIVNGSLFGATSIAIGNAHACAVRSDGSVQCWGGGGLVGDGTTVGRFTPVSVPGLDDVVGIGVGFLHTCAVRKAGDVLCWGIGTSGQTTNSLGLQLNSPTPVSGLPRPALGIAAHEGSHTCAVLNDGTAWCWGANMTGQLGDGTITARYTPTPMKMN